MAKHKHKYEYRVSPHAAAAKIVRMTSGHKRILELGSGPGAITRLLHANGCEVTALELDPDAIELVSPYCEKVIPCNLNDPHWPNALANDEPFEAIVAGDVLEHLYDPWATLNRLGNLLAPGGSVILSLPHAGHNALVACLLTGDLTYQPWGLLDKTHIRFFCVRNIQHLAEEAGFKIVEADFVIKRPEQTEFARRWRQLPDSTKKALSINRYGDVYQVVVRLIRREFPGRGIRLEALNLPAAPPQAFSVVAIGKNIVAYFLSFLSLNQRQRLSFLLQRLGIRH